jgi:hypothetical protein
MADLALLLVVPVAFACLQLLGSSSLLDLLTFESTNQTLHGLFGHWMVHYSGLLLIENAAGFLLFGSVAYLLAWLLDERRWFRLSMVTILLVVPPLSAIVSAWGFGRLIPDLAYQSRGASAVVAAVLGLLYVFGLGVVHRVYDFRAAVSIGGAMLVGSFTVLLLQIGTGSPVRALTLAGSAVAILVFDLVERRFSAGGHLTVRVVPLASVGSTSVAIFLIMAVAFLALFPADPFEGATITNVFAHATGFGLGVTIGVWGRRYWTADSWF